MENGVDLVYTENYIMPKKEFQLRGGISMDNEGSQLPKKDNDIPNTKTAIPVNDSDFWDFPDLSQPLPEVSIREQQRLTSVNRGKVLSWQRVQQQHFLAMWHSHSTGDQA